MIPWWGWIELKEAEREGTPSVTRHQHHCPVFMGIFPREKKTQKVREGAVLRSSEDENIKIANVGHWCPCARHSTYALLGPHLVLTPQGWPEVQAAVWRHTVVRDRASDYWALASSQDHNAPWPTRPWWYSNLHRVSIMRAAGAGASTFDGAQVLFYKNSSKIGRKVCSRCLYNRSLWCSLIYHQLAHEAKNIFWLTTWKTFWGPLVVGPLMPTSVEKIIVYARKLYLQHNFNWPETLPKYFTKKSFIYKAIYFSESISVPKLALVNCKGQSPPSNAISMAAKGVAGGKALVLESGCLCCRLAGPLREFP